MRKRIAIAAGALLACLVIALVVLRVVGLDPQERRPGLWLTGHLVMQSVADWSFTEKYPTIGVQTRSWSGLPHSVTTSITVHDGRLYLTSNYRPGQQFPRDRLWNRNILRDPWVRLKIGDRLFDGTVSLVADAAQKDAVLETKAKKYPRQRSADKSLVYVFRFQQG